MKNFMVKSVMLMTLAISLIAFCSFSIVTDEEMLAQGVTQEQLDELKSDVLLGQRGTIHLKECHASLNVPTDFIFLDKDQARHLLIDYWNNPESHLNNLLGVLVPGNCDYFYQINTAYVISYNNDGYVRDDDANSIDYDDLLEIIQEAESEENKSLLEEQRSTTVGWARTPKYINDEHVLVWAKTIDFPYGQAVNYDMRILGKEGLVSINAVVAPEECDEVVASESEMINSLVFDKGYAYSDFDASKDRVSDWTVGGLVAGSMLAKSGALGKIGVALLKFWKIIAIGVVAIGAGITKFLKKKRLS